MMKNAIIFAKCHSIAELLQKTLLLILLIPIASSCEKEGGSQPDPPGTITQNMAEDYEYPVGISLAGVYSWHACTLSWTTPSTIWVDGYRNMYTDDVLPGKYGIGSRLWICCQMHDIRRAERP